MSTKGRSGNGRSSSGPRSRRGNTPTPPPIEALPVVSVPGHLVPMMDKEAPKPLNVTQPMNAVPAPLIAREPFQPVSSLPPVAAKEVPAVKVAPVPAVKEPAPPLRDREKDALLGRTLLEFGAKPAAEAPKPITESKPVVEAPKPIAERPLLDVVPSSTSVKAATPMTWQNAPPGAEEVKKAEPAKPEAVAVAEALRKLEPAKVEEERKPESRRPDGKRTSSSGGSGRHAALGEIDEKFFEEGTRSEHDLMAVRDPIQSDTGMELETLDPKGKMRPEVQARRARNARYVMAVSAVSTK